MSDYCYCDGEHADLYSREIRKARNQHVYSECKNIIEPGDEYHYILYLFKGELGHEKMCEFCVHDLKVLSDLGMCVPLGFLEEAWSQAMSTKKEI